MNEKIKVMIVDDELPIREWLKYAINELDMAVEIVGVCKDGKDALTMYVEKKPDLCIADIKMPNMNGIELLKHIKEVDSDAYVIMLTSHDDFELARQSLKYGATEYILKNEVTSELLADMIKNYTIRYRRDENLKFDYEEHIEDRSLYADQFVLAVNIDLNFDTSLLGSLGYKIDGIDSGYAYKYDNYRLIVVVKLVHFSRYMDKYNTILSLAKEVEAIYGSAVGACEAVGEAMDYDKAVNMSLLALGASYYDKKPNCLYMQIEGNSDESLKELSKRRNEIIEYINQMRFDKAKEQIEDYFTFLKTKKILDIEIVKQSLADFIASYKLYKLRFNTESLRIKASSYQDRIRKSRNIYVMEATLQSFMEKAFDIEESFEYHYSSYVNKAIAYIKEKYASIEQIKDVSNYLGLNQEYLCRMFKSETGITINNYLTDQRIRVAGRLLRTTDLKVNEIAELVGYNSLSYFSRAFSKKMNQSPHDYRMDSKY